MQQLFSTKDYDARSSFNIWRDIVAQHVVPLEIFKTGDRPFYGKISRVDLGNSWITQVRATATSTSLTQEAVRRSKAMDTATFVFMQRGSMCMSQDQREAKLRPGDIALVDHRPTKTFADDDGQALYMDIPLKTVEQFLGRTQIYSALTIDSALPSTRIAVTFFNELISVKKDLSLERAEHMTSIGVELLVASIAEKIAQDVPKSISGDIIVQRAKLYIETNLHDKKLDPPYLAQALGISLRHLQQLFHDRGQHVSDWIWRRRLLAAAMRLSDPGLSYLSIGNIAYGCGFDNQSHFSRRFKEFSGITPTEYRYNFNRHTLKIDQK